MEITCLKVGDLSTNCYLATDKETNQTFIIDPADEGDFISTTILEKRLTPIAVILTHGHYDHCLAALELKLNFNIPIYLHQKDLFLYGKAHSSAKHFSHINIPKLPPIDKFLSEGDILKFGSSELKVIHTPGHTPGSICLLYVIPTEVEGSHTTEQALFTGDTIFAEGIGRTDLSYSSPSDLRKSLQKIKPLLEDSLIYPGHENYGVYTSI
jgi:glyoxylase-like metal-dependent hydrolase (beta-lactamase superfamily II)